MNSSGSGGGSSIFENSMFEVCEIKFYPHLSKKTSSSLNILQVSSGESGDDILNNSMFEQVTTSEFTHNILPKPWNIPYIS